MAGSSNHDQQQRRRDATTFFLLGGFFTSMGLLVLIATLWTVARPHAMVVNFVAGLVLLVIGVGMIAFGGHLWRRSSPGADRWQ
jgi:uncharacterized membrane protein YoaK (UPF0700 family)